MVILKNRKQEVSKTLKPHSILTQLIALENPIPQLQTELLGFEIFVRGAVVARMQNRSGGGRLTYIPLFMSLQTYVHMQHKQFQLEVLILKSPQCVIKNTAGFHIG
jgi:hypothetical protein